MLGRCLWEQSTYDKLFVADGSRERSAEERHSEVVCIVSLVCDNMFEQRSLVP